MKGFKCIVKENKLWRAMEEKVINLIRMRFGAIDQAVQCGIEERRPGRRG